MALDSFCCTTSSGLSSLGLSVDCIVGSTPDAIGRGLAMLLLKYSGYLMGAYMSEDTVQTSCKLLLTQGLLQSLC